MAWMVQLTPWHQEPLLGNQLLYWWSQSLHSLYWHHLVSLWPIIKKWVFHISILLAHKFRKYIEMNIYRYTICSKILLTTNTVNQLLLACKNFSQGSQKPHHHEYFMLQTSPLMSHVFKIISFAKISCR